LGEFSSGRRSDKGSAWRLRGSAGSEPETLLTVHIRLRSNMIMIAIESVGSYMA
jgi:hypothetical protein